MLACLLAGGQSAPAATIEHRPLDDDIDAIVIMGEITAGDEERFRALSLQHRKALVILNSDGGAIAPALEIGKMIRISGYPTVVPRRSTCTSACALIWLAGPARYLSPAGRLGFHASYSNVDGRLEQSGVSNALVGSYLTQLDLPQRAIIFATQAAPDQISWLTEQNKSYAGIDFKRFEDGEQAAAPEGSATPPVTAQATPRAEDAEDIDKQRFTSADAIARYMRSEFRSDDGIGEAIRALGLGSEYDDLIKQHLIPLYANDRFIERLAGEIFAVRNLIKDETTGFAVVQQISQELTLNLTFSGMMRLNDDDVRSFAYYLMAVPANLPDAECKASYSETGGSAASEFRAIAKLGPTHLAKYLALQRRAIEAELSNYPAAIVVPKNQVELGEQLYGTTLLAALNELGEPERQRLAAAMDNPATASDKDVCNGYYISFKVMHDIDGMPGNWYRRQFMQALARQ